MNSLPLLFIAALASTTISAQAANLQKFDCKIDPEASAKVYSDQYRAQVNYRPPGHVKRIGVDPVIVASVLSKAVQAGIARNAKGDLRFVLDKDSKKIVSAQIHATDFNPVFDKMGADVFSNLTSYKAVEEHTQKHDATVEELEKVEQEVSGLPAKLHLKPKKNTSNLPDLKGFAMSFAGDEQGDKMIRNLQGGRKDIEFFSPTQYGNFIMKKPEGGTNMLSFMGFEMKCKKGGSSAEPEKEEAGNKDAT